MARTIPFAVQPLQPALVQPFHRPGWVFEEKVDGWRMIAYKTGRDVRLVSRRGVDHTGRFPDLAKAIAALPGATLVLDGEVAVFDDRLVSRFDLLSDPDPDELAPRPCTWRSMCFMRGAGISEPGRSPPDARCSCPSSKMRRLSSPSRG